MVIFSVYLNNVFLYFTGLEVLEDITICNSVVSGGVALYDMQSVSVRRVTPKHPVHELQTFIPYISTVGLDAQDDVVRYTEYCSTLARLVLKKIIEHEPGRQHHLLKPVEEMEEIVFKKDSSVLAQVPDYAGDTKHVYSEKLRAVLDMINGDKHLGNVLNFTNLSTDAFHTDILCAHLFQTEIMKPCLDVVQENVIALPLKITAVGDTHMAKTARSIIDSSALVSVSYTVTKDVSLPSNASETENDQAVVEWKLGDAKPKRLEKSHLVIVSNAIRKYKDIRKALQSLSEIVEDGGFLLIQEVTTNFHISSVFDDLLDSAVQYEDLPSRTSSIYCNASTWRRILSEEDFDVVSEVSDNLLSTIFLVRKRRTNPMDSQEIIDITNHDCEWLEHLKLEMHNKPKGANLWLRADSGAHGILGLVKCLRLEPGGDRIR